MTTTASPTTARTSFSAADETAAAITIEAGVLAAAALTAPARLDGTDAELLTLVQLGQAALHDLLTAHAWLVSLAVAQEFRGIGSRDDLTQQAWLSLAEAVRRFDHRRGRFSTYALPFVRAGVRTAMAREQGLSERQQRGTRKALWAETTLTQELGRTPVAEEVADLLGRDTGWLQWCRTRGTTAPQDLMEEIVDPVQTVTHAPYGPCDGTLAEALASLPRVARTIVTGRHLAEQPMSYEALAAMLHVTTRTVRRWEHRALAVLRTHLTTSARSVAA